MAPRSKRTPRLAPEHRRRQILDATAAAVADQGFQGLTIDAIAREAGITRPVIYDQFGDLAGLLDAFVEDADARAMAAVAGAVPDPAAEGPPDELLGSATRAFLEAVRNEPALWRIVLAPPEGSPATVRGRIEQRRGELTEQIAVLVDAAGRRHGILAGIDVRLFARVLVAIVEDMGRLILERPNRYSPARVARAYEQIARLIPPRQAPAAGAGR